MVCVPLMCSLNVPICGLFFSLYGCVHDNSENFIAFGQLIRSRYGPRVLQIWSQNDLNMVPIWFQYDPNVLQEWPQVGPPSVISSAPTFIMVIGHRISFTQAKITFFKKSNFGRTYVYNDYWPSDFICVSKHQVLKKNGISSAPMFIMIIQLQIPFALVD